MPLNHDTILYDVHDCHVYPLTSDSGASPVFGAGVDVPGIFAVGLNPNIVSAVLKGDAKVIDRRARIDEFPVTATYSKLSLDVLDVIMEGDLNDTGATPNQHATFDVLGDNALPYFGIVFQIEDIDTDLGAVRLILWKAKLTGGTLLGTQSDQYGQPTMELSGLPTASHDKMMRIEFLETMAAVGGTFPA